METIAIITDKDLGLPLLKMNNPTLRIGARGIVVRDGLIAVIHKQATGEYKLPGGGVDNHEDPQEGFIREIKEETGCSITNIQYLGITEEHKTKNNFKQISHIYMADVVNQSSTSYTKQEIDEKTSMLWLTPHDALAKIKSCYDCLNDSDYASIYMTKFIILRDTAIIEYYIRLLERNNETLL